MSEQTRAKGEKRPPSRMQKAHATGTGAKNKTDSQESDGKLSAEIKESSSGLPADVRRSQSATFDHHVSKNSADQRFLLRQQLVKEKLSEEVIEEIVRNHPKTCKCRYRFSYPKFKRRTMELFPLARICCLNPSLDLVRLVHETYPEAIAEKDDEGRLPLHCACRFDASKSVVDYLIQHYGNAVKIQTSKGVLPLHYSCRNQNVEVVHDLISLYPESVEVTTDLSWLPLHYACNQEKESRSNMLVSYLISLWPHACQEKTTSGSLPLHYAAGEASFPTIKTLLSVYPDGVRVRNKSQSLPLHHACYRRAPIKVINLMVQLYPDSVTCSSSKGSTPIQIVTDNESPPAVLLYLARVESALDTLNSLPFDARCKILDSMMNEALQETQTGAKSVSKVAKASIQGTIRSRNDATENEGDDRIDPDTVDTSSEQVNETIRRANAIESTSGQTTTATTTPGAVRMRGVQLDDTVDDGDDSDIFTDGQDESKEELIVASEIAPRVTELESELEVFRRRFKEDVVVADKVVTVPTDEASRVDSKCCVIL